LGEGADPLSRVKVGSAIAFVCELGARLDGVVGDHVTVKRERLYALEMLVATAIVHSRNMVAARLDDGARGLFAHDLALTFLTEALRYFDGAEAQPAPIFQTMPIHGQIAQERRD
jgi:hypothetical protein